MALDRSTGAIIANVLAASLSMVNFSYDASMINQLLLNDNFFLYFELNAATIGLTVAILNVGNTIAGPFVGPLMDWVGRKRSILLANCLSIVGVVIAAAAQNIGMLLAGRCILGFALTISAVAGPTLIAEATPGHLHSLLTNTAMPGLPIIGTIISAAGIAVYESKSDWGWRGIILGEISPPLLSSLLLVLVPESPRWLVFKGRLDEARKVLDRIHPEGELDREAHINTEFEEIVQTIEFERKNDESIKALVAKPSDRRRFLIVVLTNIFYQICGANTLPYFFTLVLQSIGIADLYTTLYLNVGLGAWGAVSVTSGLWINHRFGAKTVLLFNTTMVTICLALLAILTGLGPENGRGIGAVVVIFVFWFFSTSCWMILEYSYPVEILRFSLRGKGAALGQSIGYAFLLLMTYTLPTALQELGWKFYAINAGWDVIIVILIWWLFVETKGKSLEEIDLIFDGIVHFSINEIDAEIIVGTTEKTIGSRPTSITSAAAKV